MYLNKGELEVGIMERGMAWLDTGTVDAMDDASEFVRVMEKRTGNKIACIEEIAYLHGYINKEQAIDISRKYGKSGYGTYILKAISE
jgi:glucose-1-phosphate thymidylyltransferase